MQRNKIRLRNESNKKKEKNFTNTSNVKTVTKLRLLHLHFQIFLESSSSWICVKVTQNEWGQIHIQKAKTCWRMKWSTRWKRTIISDAWCSLTQSYWNKVKWLSHEALQNESLLRATHRLTWNKPTHVCLLHSSLRVNFFSCTNTIPRGGTKYRLALRCPPANNPRCQCGL